MFAKIVCRRVTKWHYYHLYSLIVLKIATHIVWRRFQRRAPKKKRFHRDFRSSVIRF